MAIAQLSRKTSNYQFPVASLTAHTLPAIDVAMAEAECIVFERNYSYLVDAKPHAALCVSAYKAGYVGDADLEPFAASPRLLALHRLSLKAVAGIGSAVGFSSRNLFNDPERLETVLSTKAVPKEVVGELALGLSAAGVIDPADLHSLIVKGSYTAPLVMDQCLKALRGVAGDVDGLSYDLNLYGDQLAIESGMPTYYDFSLSDVPTEERAELSILMQKAFDAIQTFVIPIHTPATFIGSASYFSPGLDEAVSAIKESISDLSREGIETYLSALEPEQYPFDAECLGLCEGEEGGVDEDSFQRVVDTLADAVICHKDYSYTLGGANNADKVVEVHTLISQANELAVSGKTTASIHRSLVPLLECALTYANDPLISLDEFTGSHDEGMGFFETFVIRMDESELEGAYSESYGYVDMLMGELGCATINIPIQRDMVARGGMRTIQAIKTVHSLLTNLSSATEAAYAK